MKTIKEIIEAIEKEPARSAWDKGVKEYAGELAEELAEAIKGGYFVEDNLLNASELRKQLLNGAEDWSAYSCGGGSLIYDGDIAERLCSPSELKKSRNGERRPNNREEWLDTQARALTQAANMVIRIAKS